jgi:hypothetical protein
VHGASCHDAVTFLAAVSTRVISPSAGRVTKIPPFPSPTAALGRPLRGMVAMTWLVAVSMTVALRPRELKTNRDLVAESKTMA